MVVSLVSFFLIFVPYGWACLPKPYPAAIVPTTTAAPCVSSDLHGVAVFLKSDVTLVDLDIGDGATPPVDTCDGLTCEGGDIYRYSSTKNDTPLISANKDSMGGLLSTTCPNMCMCQDDGTCWKLTSPTPPNAIQFWQYCTGDPCRVYVYIYASDRDVAGITSLDGSRTIYASQMWDYGNNKPYPVTAAGKYIDILKIGCDGCAEGSCKAT